MKSLLGEDIGANLRFHIVRRHISQMLRWDEIGQWEWIRKRSGGDKIQMEQTLVLINNKFPYSEGKRRHTT